MKRTRCGGGVGCVVGALKPWRRCCRARLARTSRWVVVRGSVGSSLLVVRVVVRRVWWGRAVVVGDTVVVVGSLIWWSRRTTS
jgi:hypothetical protein